MLEVAQAKHAELTSQLDAEQAASEELRKELAALAAADAETTLAIEVSCRRLVLLPASTPPVTRFIALTISTTFIYP